jgi:septum site-determining protein MinD
MWVPDPMKSVTFTVSKGGVGKSLITANVGASLAKKGKKVVLVEGDPNQPLQKILGLTFSYDNPKLEDVVEKNLQIEKASYPTGVSDLSLIPSGISLQSYFEIDPLSFVRKLGEVKADFLLIDVPFPLGKAAFLSLGFCEYFVPVLTEDEIVLCVESTIDTIRLGNYFLKSTPVGFILNRIKTSKFTEEFVKDLEGLLEIPCIAQIREDPAVTKSYGEMGSQHAFLAYAKLPDSEFAKKIDSVAAWLISERLRAERKDVVKLLQEVIRP